MVSPVRRVLLLILLAAACRRDVSRLDDVQKMVYAVKPAVVRINAYATAQFHYPASSLDKIAREVGLARRDGIGEGVVETGAGGSGSGFIIHPGGWMLTSGHVVARTRDTDALQKELRSSFCSASVSRVRATTCPLVSIHPPGWMMKPLPDPPAPVSTTPSPMPSRRARPTSRAILSSE